jgi:hypothetical protein
MSTELTYAKIDQTILDTLGRPKNYYWVIVAAL